jgi:hypothetical protein
MPWTQKPKSFADFLYDAEDVAPLLVYHSADLPRDLPARARGRDCRAEHEAWEAAHYNRLSQHTCVYVSPPPLTCSLGDLCLTDTFGFETCRTEADYQIVVPDGMADWLPRSWLHSITHQAPYCSIDWIRVTDAMARTLIREGPEPLAAIWEYNKGPRPFCQHGGDEDWTAVVRRSVYCAETDAEADAEYDDTSLYWDLGNNDELRFIAFLDCCGTSQEDEEDFRVFTGAHA